MQKNVNFVNRVLLLKMALLKIKQQFKCKRCKKYFILHYTYKTNYNGIDELIKKLIQVKLAIRGMAKVLEISTTTLLKRIVSLNYVTNSVILSNLIKFILIS